MHGTRRAGRADTIPGHVAVAGQHEDIVAQRLEVVADIVARDIALRVQKRQLLVGLLRQMAAEATGIPRRVAGDAAHVFVGVGAAAVARDVAPDHGAVAVAAHCLGQGGLGVVMLVARRDHIPDLHDLPGQVFLDHGVLHDDIAAALEAALAERRAQRLQVAATFRGRGVGGHTGRPQRGPLGGAAVAIDAARRLGISPPQSFGVKPAIVCLGFVRVTFCTGGGDRRRFVRHRLYVTVAIGAAENAVHGLFEVLITDVQRGGFTVYCLAQAGIVVAGQAIVILQLRARWK